MLLSARIPDQGLLFGFLVYQDALNNRCADEATTLDFQPVTYPARDDRWSSVTYYAAKRRFIALDRDNAGASGSVMYSSDGQNWTRTASFNDSATWNGVSSDGNRTLIAVGFTGGPSAASMISTDDGISWSSANIPSTSPNAGKSCIGRRFEYHSLFGWHLLRRRRRFAYDRNVQFVAVLPLYGFVKF